jgi:hypothetical protein
MKTTRTEQFICPECGSEECDPTNLNQASKRVPGLRRDLVCARCRFEIPAHLAERWGGISVEEARKEWRLVYRNLCRPGRRGVVSQTQEEVVK